MKTNLLKSRVQIQLRTAIQTALGQTVVWKPVADRYACVIPLDAKARAVYQQLKSEVTHRIIFSKGAVSLSLGNNRILHSGKIYEPVEPQQIIDGNIIVVVREI